MWRGHSCLPRPYSLGHLSGVYSAAGGQGFSRLLFKILSIAVFSVVLAVCHTAWQSNPDSPQPSQSDQGLNLNPEEIYDAKDYDDCRISVGLPGCSRPNPHHLHRTAWNILHYLGERLRAA